MIYRNKILRLYGNIKKDSILIMVMIAILLLTGCKRFLKTKVANDVSIPTSTITTEIFKTDLVQRQTLEKNKMFHGIFVSTKQESLSFKDTSGYLKGVYVSSGDKVKSGMLLAELDADSIKSQVKQQEIKLKIAELDYDVMKRNSNINSYELEKLALNIESIKMELDKVSEQLGNTRIYASMEGVITDVAKVEIGDFVPTNSTFITMSSDKPSELLLKCKGEVGKLVQVGQKVTVILRSSDHFFGKGGNPNNINEKLLNIDPQNIKEGTVVMCPSVLPTDKDTASEDIVFIAIKDLPEGISVGEGADMKYVYARRENAIFVRYAQVETVNKDNFVYVLKDNKKVKTLVELGIQIGSNVEIVKGLQEGDKLVTSEISF